MSHPTPKFSISITGILRRTTGRTYVKPGCNEPRARIIPIEDPTDAPELRVQRSAGSAYPKYVGAHLVLAPNVIVPAHRRGETERTFRVLSGRCILAIHAGTSHPSDWHQYDMDDQTPSIAVKPNKWLAILTAKEGCTLSTLWLQRDIKLPAVIWENDVESLWNTVSE